uniref:Uncharacterized protein n=1 Tax=Anguilla anguilla TaxID=7936 RepID=A0A0E9PSK0_ANGAN
MLLLITWFTLESTVTGN